MLLLALHQPNFAATPEATGSTDPSHIRKLIGGLGANDFKTREAAQLALIRGGRSVLPVLAEYVNSDDPEIRTRVGEISDRIKQDQSSIPQTFSMFESSTKSMRSGDKAWWIDTVTKWSERANVCVSNMTGNIGLAGTIAQSFVPHCDRISMMLVMTYPIQSGWGWVRVDLCEDREGRPGEYVLARSWLRMDRDCPVPHSGFAPYPIPTTHVDPKRLYWLQVREFPDEDSPAPHNITNIGLSPGNRYAEGALLGDPSDSGNDALFMIVSQSEEFPFLHNLTRDDLERLPASARLPISPR